MDLCDFKASQSEFQVNPRPSLVPQDLTRCVTCQEKHITVKKEPHESLGMTVAGGRGSKSGELPIFVTSVPPHGCLARDGRIKRGKAGSWKFCKVQSQKYSRIFKQ